MDRERADFHQALKEVREVLEVQAVPILLPIGREAGFKGVVDLIGQKAYVAAARGGKLEAGPIPDDLKDEVEAPARRSAQFCRRERRRPDREIPGRRGTHAGGDLPGTSGSAP